MADLLSEFANQINELIFFLRICVYFILCFGVIWVIGFVRRNLGLDAQSIELRRIRRILEDIVDRSRKP